MANPAPTATGRNFARVDCPVHLAVRALAPGEHGPIPARILQGVSPVRPTRSLDHLDDDDLEMFSVLNAKLDRILNILEAKSAARKGAAEQDFSSLPLVGANVSAGGVAYLSSREYEMGQMVEIRLGLPMAEPLHILSHGEIVRCARGKNSWMVAANFLNMSDSIKEAIVNFVFEQQREIAIQARR